MARRRHTRRRRHHRSVAVLYKLLSVVVISGAIVAALTLFFKVETIRFPARRNTAAKRLSQLPASSRATIYFY